MPTHHEITIKRKGRHAIPDPFPCSAMEKGDTARYSSSDGAVKVVFVDASSGLPASPFDHPGDKTEFTGPVIEGSGIQKVEHGGDFEVRCFIKTPADQDFIGWHPTESPQSGGVFPVRPM